MRVGINRELAAEVDPAAQPAPIEVEPPRIAVDLDRDVLIVNANRENPLVVVRLSLAAEIAGAAERSGTSEHD